MRYYLSRFIKIGTIISIAGLMMGNQSCDKKQQPEPRSLKKIVSIGMISSQPVKLPDGNIFDFQFVVNQQVYNVLYESKAFAFRDNTPITGISMASDGSVLGKLNFSKASLNLYEKIMDKSAERMVFPSQLAYCLINKPQFKIGGSVTSFELIGGGGLRLGFNQLGNFSGAGIGANFKVNVSQLELIMKALSPMKNAVLSSVSFRANKTEQAGGFDLMIGPFSVGPSYYYNTPMAKVTRTALSGAIDLLKKDLQKAEWFSRILDYREEGGGDLITVIGGNDVGMQIGDQLAVYNEITYWEGEPCNSSVTNEGGALGKPIGIIQITDVSPELSSGFFTEKFQDFNPEYIPGAKLKVHKLKTNDAPGISQAKK